MVPLGQTGKSYELSSDDVPAPGFVVGRIWRVQRDDTTTLLLAEYVSQ
jgi:hypothetical protein